MRFRLRTLMIVLAIGPLLLAGAWSVWLRMNEPPTILPPLFSGEDIQYFPPGPEFYKAERDAEDSRP